MGFTWFKLVLQTPMYGICCADPHASWDIITVVCKLVSVTGQFWFKLALLTPTGNMTIDPDSLIEQRTTASKHVVV